MHKVGDVVWRGYARHYGNPAELWPEIRPGIVREIDEDGAVSVALMGTLPGREGKRSGGAWMAWNQPADRYHPTPEAALAAAVQAVAQHKDAAAETPSKQ